MSVCYSKTIKKARQTEGVRSLDRQVAELMLYRAVQEEKRLVDRIEKAGLRIKSKETRLEELRKEMDELTLIEKMDEFVRLTEDYAKVGRFVSSQGENVDLNILKNIQQNHRSRAAYMKAGLDTVIYTLDLTK